MAMSFIAGWLALDRAFTGRVLTAAIYIGVAGMLSAAAALATGFILRRKPWSARFAAALLLLTAGTGGLAALQAGVRTAWIQHALPELPIEIALLILAINIAAALYGFLAIAAPLILPLGLPLIVMSAFLIARASR